MATNPSIYAALERLWQHVVALVGGKANINHDHNDLYYTESEIDNKIGNKVDKENGKGLSTNDYTTEEKEKLATIDENANNYTHYSGTSAGTYRSVTVNEEGHVTVGTNPVVTVAQGGTGATTAPAALTNLGITATAAEINKLEGVTDNIQTQINSISDLAEDVVLKSGDTMTGALTLSGNPTEDLHATTKQYVDSGLTNVAFINEADNEDVSDAIVSDPLLTSNVVQESGNSTTNVMSQKAVTDFVNEFGNNLSDNLGELASKDIVTKDELSSDLQESINKADAALPKSGGTMTGDITLSGAPTADLHAASKAYVDSKVASIVDSAPGTLDTLNELAAALGDDANFATTVANNLGNKVDKVTGKGLSTNDYTTAEKEKLDGIEDGAQVNNVWYGTCDTTGSTAAKVVTTDTSDFVLKSGSVVKVRFTNAHTASSMTLNVDGTGAKTVYLNGQSTNFAAYYTAAYSVISFVYDGTNFRAEFPRSATTTYYGVTKLSSSTSSTSTSLAATASAVKSAYDLATTANTTADAALPKSGGTMTGAITLNGAPTEDLHAVTKKYVDDIVGDIESLLAQI